MNLKDGVEDRDILVNSARYSFHLTKYFNLKNRVFSNKKVSFGQNLELWIYFDNFGR